MRSGHAVRESRPERNQAFLGRVDAAAMLAGAVLAVSVLLSFRSLEQFGDSLSYAVAVKNGPARFHPHHLLFFPIVRTTYDVVSFFRPSTDVILAAQLHNAFWAAVTLAGIFAIVVTSTSSRVLGAAIAATVLGSHAFLLFASQVEVYVPAMGCLAACVAVLSVRTRHRTRAILTAAVLLSLAAFYHQSSVIVCPALAAYLGCRDGARGWRDAALLIASAAAIVLGAYLAAFAASPHPRSVDGFLAFCLRYAVSDNPGWGTAANMGPAGVHAMIESLRSCILGPPLRPSFPADLPLTLAVGAALPWNLWRLFRDRAPVTRGARALVAIWVPTHLLFFLWWLPSQTSFFLGALLPLGLLAALCLSDILSGIRRPAARVGIPVALSVLALAWLLPRGIALGLEPRHASPGPIHDEVMAYLAAVPQGCVHFTANRRTAAAMEYYGNIDADHIRNLRQRRRYFTRRGGEVHDPLPPGECVVVPLRSLASGADRQSTAVEYSRYLKWMFRVEEDPATGRLSAPPVRRLVHPDGEAYLVSEGEPVDHADLRGFCRSLDEAGSPLEPAPGTLERWYLAHEDVLSGPSRGAPRDRVPKASPRPRRKSTP